MTESWWPDLSQASGPKYQAIADAIGAAVARQELREGDRLPPQRELAAGLGVDLTTVTKAYELIRRRGLIEARGRAGSFVASPDAVPAALAPPDIGMNMPPELHGGILARAMRDGLTALLARPGAARLHYPPAGGAPQDRATGVALLAERGLPATEEQVIVTAGGQNALHAILSASLAPGAAVACGRFVYPGFRALAERLGLKPVPLAEMSATALETACRAGPIDALYVVPTGDNPTGVTLAADERAAIAAVAADHGVQVIEDDAYAQLAADPIPPIAAFAPTLSWHVASMSKILSPALRVAWVRAPSVRDALRLAADVHETAIMAPPLNAALVGAWLADGSFARLVAAMRRESAARQALAADILGAVPHRGHPQGYHFWLELPDGITEGALVEAMRPTGLSLVPGERFAVAPDAPQAVRVSLGGAIDRERLGRALRILHGHVAAPLGRAAPVI